MAPIDSVFFGTPTGIDSVRVSTNVETQEIMDGLSEASHTKTIQIQIEKSGTICDAYGIGQSDDAGRNNTEMIIDSATYSQTEIVSEPCMETHPEYVNDGDFSAPDHSKVLQFYDQHVFLGIEETIQLEFKYRGHPAGGTLGDKLLTAGRHIDGPLLIGPAATSVVTAPGDMTSISDYYAATDATWPYIHYDGTGQSKTVQFCVRSVVKNQDEEWHTASVELYRKLGIINSADTAFSPLKSKLYLFAGVAKNSSDTSAWKPSSVWYGYNISDITMFSLSSNFSLSAGANPKVSETLNIFPASSSDPILSLT